ncbi:MAG: glycosyltransferase WbuB, partial [Clostridia bacterium]|nr:glycosyltransferase WbuB [Clostridia bacterium]
YGGNMGMPQDIPFFVSCLKRFRGRSDCFFVICGAGCSYGRFEQSMKESGQANLLLIPGLTRNEYDTLLEGCDIGLIFLDSRFTVPNFPSRLLSYLEKSIPVLCCTDCSTDVGIVCEQNGFGWRCMSDSTDGFATLADKICGLTDEEIARMGEKGRQYLELHYTASDCCRKIAEDYATQKPKGAVIG